MKGLCDLNELIKELEEYRKKKVKKVCVEIEETGKKEIIIAPDRNDVPVMKIDWLVQIL